MVVLHYAGISKNKASGVSVIVPQIMDTQTTFAKVGFFNYGKESFDTVQGVVRISDILSGDDYHTFPDPFNRPDIVVFHSPFGIPQCVRITKMLKNDKIPYVIVPHGCFSCFAMEKKWLKKKIARIVFMDRMVKSSAGIQYLSKGEMRASVYTADCFVVPNGVYASEYLEKDRKKLLEISFIGRKDIYHKGLDFLIEACMIAKEQLKDKVRVNIYGPEADSKVSSVSQMIDQCGVGDFVHNFPAVFGEDKKKVYANTDVFVLTSRFEGQPVAILESWASGVPTLVTPGANVAAECTENNCGWAIEADSKAIADKLIYLINNREEIKQYAKNAYLYAQKMYSWENVGKLYHAEYQKILNTNNV